MNCVEKMEFKIDYEFKRLSKTLGLQEYFDLEQEIKKNGSMKPVIVWNGFLVAEYDRYAICDNSGIPYKIIELDLDCREAVISWLCAKQLKEGGISEEKRKFLIGLQYENEKIVNTKRRKRGGTEYSKKDSPRKDVTLDANEMDVQPVVDRVAADNNIALATAVKYGTYARALLEIDKKEPQLFSKILSGQYRISHENIVMLSRMPEDELKRFNRKFHTDSNYYSRYRKTRKLVLKTQEENERCEKPVSIKDMPEFDADADVIGLALTVPSWTNSIQRVWKKTDFEMVSQNAKTNLVTALEELNETATDVIQTLREV